MSQHSNSLATTTTQFLVGENRKPLNLKYVLLCMHALIYLCAQVIKSLKRALQPSVTNVEVNFQLGTSSIDILQAPAKIPTIFKGDKVVIYAIFKSKDGSNVPGITGTATLKGQISDQPIEHSVSFELPALPLAGEKEGDSLTGIEMPVVHHLAAKSLLSDWSNGLGWSATALTHERKEGMIKLSVDSSVISEHTAFVAYDMDQELPIQGAMKVWDLTASAAVSSKKATMLISPARANFWDQISSRGRSRNRSRSRSKSRSRSRSRDRGSRRRRRSQSRDRGSRRSRSRDRGSRRSQSRDRGSRRRSQSRDRSGRRSQSRDRGSRRNQSRDRGSRRRSQSRDRGSRRRSQSRDRSGRRSRSRDRGNKSGHRNRWDRGSMGAADNMLRTFSRYDQEAYSQKRCSASDPLTLLISLQQAAGFWALRPLADKVIKKQGASMEPPQGVPEEVWATVLALVFLEVYCSGKRDEWELIAGKAEAWLTSQTQPGVSLSQLREKAREFYEAF